MGCLKVKDARNLWAAGRTISTDSLALGSVRVMGTGFATGHAAGVAAALTLDSESYDVKASGYLLKPTTYEKLCSLLNDCKQAFHYEPESIIVKTDKGYRKIYYHLIECVEAQNKKVLFCLNDGECLEVLDTFVHCSNELTTNDAFYKCHRSYLVHMPAIDHFNSIEIETKTHKKVPIARSYAKSFKEAYFEYMFKEGD